MPGFCLSKTAVAFAGLQGNFPGLCQLGQCDEAKPFGLQSIYDLQSRIHGTVGHVVKQDHIPISGLCHHLPNDGLRILGIPIPGIYGPQNQGQLHLLCGKASGVVALSTGRPQELYGASCREQCRSIGKLVVNFLKRHSVHGLVGLAMEADLMALLMDLLC